jgi:hypothetical protein
MKVTNYSLFGDDLEYCEITFEDKYDKVTISRGRNNKWGFKADDVSIDLIKEVIEVIESGKIEIEV